MIPLTTRASEHIALFGLGSSGRTTARALSAGGARITAWDDDREARRRAAAEGIPLGDITRSDWTGFSALVLGPGVPLTHPTPHPVVNRARHADVAIIGDIELLCEICRIGTLIGVTGTNGKSTTATLIHHVLQTAGVRSQVGGNLGPPALDLSLPGPEDVLVLELSSYQLDLTRSASFDIAVLLNITPDHLDRHGNMDRYISVKQRIFRTPTRRSKPLAVVGVDDSPSRAIHAELTERSNWCVCAVSAAGARGGVTVVQGRLTDGRDGSGCDIDGIAALRGPHNWQNAAAAWAVARRFNITPAKIAAAFRSYPGLPHRMETVATLRNIRYVNDSKATNGDATARALASFRDIYWICGGVAKNGGLAPTLPWLDNVRHAFVIGAAATVFVQQLQGRVPTTLCDRLDIALSDARRRATEDGTAAPVVLLSPACASFDQYPNFEARGDHFRRLVLDSGLQADR